MKEELSPVAAAADKSGCHSATASSAKTQVGEEEGFSASSQVYLSGS